MACVSFIKSLAEIQFVNEHQYSQAVMSHPDFIRVDNNYFFRFVSLPLNLTPGSSDQSLLSEQQQCNVINVHLFFMRELAYELFNEMFFTDIKISQSSDAPDNSQNITTVINLKESLLEFITKKIFNNTYRPANGQIISGECVLLCYMRWNTPKILTPTAKKVLIDNFNKKHNNVISTEGLQKGDSFWNNTTSEFCTKKENTKDHIKLDGTKFVFCYFATKNLNIFYKIIISSAIQNLIRFSNINEESANNCTCSEWFTKDESKTLLPDKSEEKKRDKVSSSKNSGSNGKKSTSKVCYFEAANTFIEKYEKELRSYIKELFNSFSFSVPDTKTIIECYKFKQKPENENQRVNNIATNYTHEITNTDQPTIYNTITEIYKAQCIQLAQCHFNNITELYEVSQKAELSEFFKALFVCMFRVYPFFNYDEFICAKTSFFKSNREKVDLHGQNYKVQNQGTNSYHQQTQNYNQNSNKFPIIGNKDQVSQTLNKIMSKPIKTMPFSYGLPLPLSLLQNQNNLNVHYKTKVKPFNEGIKTNNGHIDIVSKINGNNITKDLLCPSIKKNYGNQLSAGKGKTELRSIKDEVLASRPRLQKATTIPFYENISVRNSESDFAINNNYDAVSDTRRQYNLNNCISADNSYCNQGFSGIYVANPIQPMQQRQLKKCVDLPFESNGKKLTPQYRKNADFTSKDDINDSNNDRHDYNESINDVIRGRLINLSNNQNYPNGLYNTTSFIDPAYYFCNGNSNNDVRQFPSHPYDGLSQRQNRYQSTYANMSGIGSIENFFIPHSDNNNNNVTQRNCSLSYDDDNNLFYNTSANVNLSRRNTYYQDEGNYDITSHGRSGNGNLQLLNNPSYYNTIAFPVSGGQLISPEYSGQAFSSLYCPSTAVSNFDTIANMDSNSYIPQMPRSRTSTSYQNHGFSDIYANDANSYASDSRNNIYTAIDSNPYTSHPIPYSSRPVSSSIKEPGEAIPTEFLPIEQPACPQGNNILFSEYGPIVPVQDLPLQEQTMINDESDTSVSYSESPDEHDDAIDQDAYSY